MRLRLAQASGPEDASLSQLRWRADLYEAKEEEAMKVKADAEHPVMFHGR
jgi:hypothetical protein